MTYNGITFSYPRTEVNVSSPGMDPSNSDQLYTVTRLKIRAYLNPQVLPSNLVDAGSVANTYSRIKHYLTMPRAPLYYDLTSAPGAVGAAPMIDLPGGRDDANGPMPDPDAFSVVYTTPETLEITWACTIKLKDCDQGNLAAPLSLRWEDTIEFDRYWKATYRRVGTLILSSRSTLGIDEYRRKGLAPSVAPGFAREAAHYTISRDGLRCDFAFQDGQIRYAPPYPAVDMDIIQQETFPHLGGMRQGQIRVSMTGIISANPIDLQRQCIAIAYSRLNASNPFTTDTGKVVGNGVFRCAEAKDRIQADFTITYTVPPAKTTQDQLLGALDWGIASPLSVAPTGLFYLAGLLSKEGRSTDKTPIFPWVGFGTTPRSAFNPVGEMGWANQPGSVGGPADGVLLAPAVRLFAALLRDPCGGSVKGSGSVMMAEAESAPKARGASASPATSLFDQGGGGVSSDQSGGVPSIPDAGTVGVNVRINPNEFNTPAGGQGGPTQISTPQFSASLSALNASEYPTTQVGVSQGSLYSWDGQPGAYDFWQCLNEYLGDSGSVVMPTSNTAGTNVVVAHSSPMVTLRKRWAASRTGSPPKLPPTTLADPNWVLNKEYEGLREMRVAPDGVSICYEVSGVYEYQALDASLVNRQAEYQPFLISSVFEGQSGAANWLDAALDPTRGQQTGGVLAGTGGNPLGSNVLPGQNR